jgi:hypothetical protein
MRGCVPWFRYRTFCFWYFEAQFEPMIPDEIADGRFVRPASAMHFGSWNRGERVVPVNSDLADTVGVEQFPSILSWRRVVGVVCRSAVAFSNSSGIAA